MTRPMYVCAAREANLNRNFEFNFDHLKLVLIHNPAASALIGFLTTRVYRINLISAFVFASGRGEPNASI